MTPEDISELLRHLRARGLPGDPGRGIEAARVAAVLTQQGGSEPALTLRRYLRPIIARSPDDQALFDSVYFEWLEGRGPAPAEMPTVHPVPWSWTKVASWIAALLVFFCAIFALKTHIESRQATVVSGRVVNTAGEPLEGVLVTIPCEPSSGTDPSGSTDAAGLYSIEVPKKVKLRQPTASKANYVQAEATGENALAAPLLVEELPDGRYPRDLILRAEIHRFRIIGTVVDVTGLPVSGGKAELVLEPSIAEKFRTQTKEISADSAGQFTFTLEGPRGGLKGKVKISLDDFRPEARDFAFAAPRPELPALEQGQEVAQPEMDLGQIRLFDIKKDVQIRGRLRWAASGPAQSKGLETFRLRLVPADGLNDNQLTGSVGRDGEFSFTLRRTDDLADWHLSVESRNADSVAGDTLANLLEPGSTSSDAEWRLRPVEIADNTPVPVEDRMLPSQNGKLPIHLSVTPTETFRLDPREDGASGDFWHRYFGRPRALWALAPVLLLGALLYLSERRGRAVFNRFRSEMPQRLRSLGLPPHRQIVDPKAISLLARMLRRRVTVESRKLVVQPTLAATLKRGGMFSPVFRSTAEPRHLLLFDSQAKSDHSARLTFGFAAALAKAGVDLEAWTFHGAPHRLKRVPIDRRSDFSGSFNPAKGVDDVVSLGDLLKKNPAARVLLFSPAEELFEPLSGRLEEWAGTVLEQRPCVLLTPSHTTPQQVWNPPERLLSQRGVLVLPFSTAGLYFWAQFLSGVQSPPSRPVQSYRQRSLLLDPDFCLRRVSPPQTRVEALFSELKLSLSPDAFLWLAACCLYPEIRWSLTIHFGDRLLVDEGRFTAALPQIVQLPWLRHGFIPEWVRVGALQRLSTGEAESVRSVVASVLAGVSHQGEAGIELVAAADALRTMREAGESASPDSPLRDYVYLQFIHGRRIDPTLLEAPHNVYQLLEMAPKPHLGRRVAMGAAAVLSAAFVLYGLRTNRGSLTGIVASPGNGTLLLKYDTGRVQVITHRGGARAAADVVVESGKPAEVRFGREEDVFAVIGDFDNLPSQQSSLENVALTALPTDTGTVEFQIDELETGTIGELEFSPSDSLAVSSVKGFDRTTRLQRWRWTETGDAAGARVCRLRIEGDPIALSQEFRDVDLLRFSADGSRFSFEVTKEDGSTHLFIHDSSTGNSVGEPIPIEDGKYTSLSRDASLVALIREGASSLTVRSVDGKGFVTDLGKEGGISYATFRPNSDEVFIVTFQGAIYRWSLGSETPPTKISDAGDLSFDAGGSRLFMADSSGRLFVCDATDPALPQVASALTGLVGHPGVNVSGDGKWVQYFQTDGWNNYAVKTFDAKNLRGVGPPFVAQFSADIASPARSLNLRYATVTRLAVPGESMNAVQVFHTGAGQESLELPLASGAKSRSLGTGPVILDEYFTDRGVQRVGLSAEGAVVIQPLTAQPVPGRPIANMPEGGGNLTPLGDSGRFAYWAKRELRVMDPAAPSPVLFQVTFDHDIVGVKPVVGLESFAVLVWDTQNRAWIYFWGEPDPEPVEIGQLPLEAGTEIQDLGMPVGTLRLSHLEECWLALVKQGDKRSIWLMGSDDRRATADVPAGVADVLLLHVLSSESTEGQEKPIRGRVGFVRHGAGIQLMDISLGNETEQTFVESAKIDVPGLAGQRVLPNLGLIATWQSAAAGGRIQFWDPDTGSEVTPTLPPDSADSFRIRTGMAPVFNASDSEVILVNDDDSVSAWSLISLAPSAQTYVDAYEKTGSGSEKDQTEWTAGVIDREESYRAIEKETGVPWYAVAIVHTLVGGDLPPVGATVGTPVTKHPPPNWKDGVKKVLPSLGFPIGQHWSVAQLLYSFDHLGQIYPDLPSTWAGTDIRVRQEPAESFGAAAYLKYSIGLRSSNASMNAALLGAEMGRSRNRIDASPPLPTDTFPATGLRAPVPSATMPNLEVPTTAEVLEQLKGFAGRRVTEKSIRSEVESMNRIVPQSAIEYFLTEQKIDQVLDAGAVARETEALGKSGLVERIEVSAELAVEGVRIIYRITVVGFTYPVALEVPGEPDLIISPYTGKELDVVGIGAGKLAKDPIATGRGIFRIRSPEMKAIQARPTALPGLFSIDGGRYLWAGDFKASVLLQDPWSSDYYEIPESKEETDQGGQEAGK